MRFLDGPSLEGILPAIVEVPVERVHGIGLGGGAFLGRGLGDERCGQEWHGEEGREDKFFHINSP
jgi:hypothetical protein